MGISIKLSKDSTSSDSNPAYHANLGSTIHFLRHAQSRTNAYNIDERNPGLTKLGKKQAGFISGDYDLVIISPFRRCVETLENSLVKFKSIVVTDECREYKRSLRDSNFLEEEEPNIEKFGDFLLRVEKFKSLLSEYSKNHKKILVISHGIFLSYLLDIRRVYNCVLLHKHITRSSSIPSSLIEVF